MSCFAPFVSGTESDVKVESREPTVAEKTGGSKR